MYFCFQYERELSVESVYRHSFYYKRRKHIDILIIFSILGIHNCTKYAHQGNAKYNKLFTEYMEFL